MLSLIACRYRYVAVFLVFAILTLSLQSCGSGDNSPVPSTRPQTAIEHKPVAIQPVGAPVDHPRLGGGEHSSEALVQAALEALGKRDTVRLRELMISREEFYDYLYPEYALHFPIAADTSQHTKKFVGDMHFLNAEKGLGKALRTLGGKKMKLVSLAFGDSLLPFTTYLIHQETQPRVRMENGSELDVEVIGSIVEMDSVYKLLSYRSRGD